VEGEIVGQGIAEQQGEEHDPGRNPHGAQQGFEIYVHAQQFAVVAKVPVLDDGLRRADRPEAVAEEQRVRD
jgi:hypothetical protein